MLDILQGDADLNTVLHVVSSICVMVAILINNKKVRIISIIIFIASIPPVPYDIPYRLGSIIVFGMISIIIRLIVSNYKNKT